MQAFIKSTEIPLRIFRVKREFTLGTILYPVGVTRLYTGADRVNFIQDLRELNGAAPEHASDLWKQLDYEKAEKFFNDHFEEVEFK